jgi:hypothetical protein
MRLNQEPDLLLKLNTFSSNIKALTLQKQTQQQVTVTACNFIFGCFRKTA